MKKLVLSLMSVITLWGGDGRDAKFKIIDSLGLSKFHKFDVSPNYYNGVLWRWYTDVKVPDNDPSNVIYYSQVFIIYTGKIKDKNDVLKARLITADIEDYQRGTAECSTGVGGELAEDYKFMWPILTGYNQLKDTDDANIRGIFLVYAPKYKTGFIERAVCLPTDMVKDLTTKKFDNIIDQKRFFERFGQYGLKPEITFDEIEKNIKDFHVFPIEKFPIDEN